MNVNVSRLRLVSASVLLATSGVLAVAAAARRWWPACGIGNFDTGACVERQDDAYHYILPHEPWEPLRTAAELQGIAMLLLAAAVLVIPQVLGGRRHGRVFSAATVTVSAAIAVMAVLQWVSGHDGQPVSMPGLWLAGLLWLLGLPVLLILSAASAAPAPSRVRAARWAVVTCCALAGNPIAHLIIASTVFAYSSHDTPPWSEAVGGVLLIGASAFLWLTAHHERLSEASSAAEWEAPRHEVVLS